MTETAITPSDDENNYPAPYVPPSALSGVHGEFGVESGPKLPTLRLIQNVGKSSIDHPKDRGGLLYFKDTIVPRPATVTFYGLQGYYVQNLAFDPNNAVMPARYETIAQVEAAGGNVTPYVKPGVDEQNYVPAALCFLLIHAPNGAKSWAKGCEEVSVPFEEGKTKELLLPAIMYLRSTGYRQLVPLLRRVSADAEKEGKQLSHARFSFDTTQSMIGGNYVFIPVVKRTADNNSEAFLELAKDIFGE